MGKLNHDAGLEFLKELILKEGKTVYSLFWDNGGPGGGAGSETIIKFKTSTGPSPNIPDFPGRSTPWDMPCPVIS